jgi:aminoglycoside phosphotransferase family enzyme/predicted kinase
LSPSEVAVSETHVGVVILLGDRAYKLKKPVRTDFLDFGTRERREEACHREVELNRRLAPDAYLGVAEVHGPDGELCDHLVVMQRMPAERPLSAIVADGQAGGDEVREIARVLAAFHSAAAGSAEIAEAGRRDAVRGRWDGVLDGLRSATRRGLPADLVDIVEGLAFDYLAGREALFDDRIEAGRVVDGHGDLLTEDIFWLPDGPQILDCLEFDDRLRWVDGLDDAAFLAMDLEHHGRPDLAVGFVNHYARFAGDPAPASLRHHYVAYRAAVRARVAAMRAEQADPPEAGAAREEAARLMRLAVRHLQRAAVQLVLVGGLPGTGKSTVAAGIADELGMAVLSSDRVRKELAGLDPDLSAPDDYREGLYSAAMTERVYTELLERAAALLARGESVVLDASWTSAGHRDRARELANEGRSTLVALHCEVGAEVATNRLRSRPGSASDADEEIAAAMAADEDSWPGAHSLSTAGTAEETVSRAAELVAGAVAAKTGCRS